MGKRRRRQKRYSCNGKLAWPTRSTGQRRGTAQPVSNDEELPPLLDPMVHRVGGRCNQGQQATYKETASTLLMRCTSWWLLSPAHGEKQCWRQTVCFLQSVCSDFVTPTFMIPNIRVLCWPHDWALNFALGFWTWSLALVIMLGLIGTFCFLWVKPGTCSASIK